MGTGLGSRGAHVIGRLCVVVVAACGGASSSAPAPDGDGASAAPSSSQEAAPAMAFGMPKELVDKIVSLDVGNPTLVETAREIVQANNAEATKLAGDQLVKVGKRVGRLEWRTERRGEIEASLRQRGAVPSAADVDLAAIDAQTAAMSPLFDAMGVVGGGAVASFAAAEVVDVTLPIERRRMASLVASKHLPSTDPRAANVIAFQLDQQSKAGNVAHLSSAADAPSVQRELAPAFKRCYVDFMKTAPPGAEFKGTLELSLGADGAVKTAKLRDNPPPTLATCIEDAAKKAKFDPPASGKATIRMPLTFAQQ